MSLTRKWGFIRSLTISFTVLGLFALCLFFGADFSTSEAKVANSANFGGTAFPGAGGGAIPDGGATGAQDPGTPVTITFAVTGVTGAPTDVSLDMDITHTWVGDIVATLTAPDGTTNHFIMSYTGNTGAATFGDSSNVAGLYTFEDAATGNWWTAATGGTSAFDIPLGSYKASDNGGTQTDISPSFTGLASANGTWTLSVTDGGAGDTGTLNAATLNITAGAAPSGATWNDYDGDGTSDYSVARDEGTPPSLHNNSNFPRNREERIERITRKPTAKSANLGAGPGSDIVWYNHRSGDSGVDIAGFGVAASDFITPNDFDGDGQTDIAVWRSAAAESAAYYIIDSSTDTVRVELFGQTGDNSSVSGDYDGDGSADVAVYRCPASAGPCAFYYRGTAGSGEITVVTWGNGTAATLFPNTGDFDGDGKNDFCVQREAPSTAGVGQFVVLRSSDFGATFVNWGTTTDIIVPGDYNGDGTHDFAVTRNEGGQKTWYVLDGSSFAVLNYATPFGLNADFEVPGDYDGDGSTDIAVWRPDAADENNNYHYVLRSSDVAVSAFEWGNSGDYPTANAQVQ